MSYKPITQAEARRNRKRIAELEQIIRSRDGVIERIILTRWNMQDLNPNMINEIKTAFKLNFRVEVLLDGQIMITTAVRRKGDL